MFSQPGALKADVWRDKKEFFNAQDAALKMNGPESNTQERDTGERGYCGNSGHLVSATSSAPQI